MVINKIDLAPYVGAKLSIMEQDAKRIRINKPFEFVNCKTGLGVEKVAEQIIRDILFDREPLKSSPTQSY